MARTRLRRKDLRGPDEFMEFTGRSWRWLQENQNKAIAIAMALVLLVVVIAGAGEYQEYRSDQAAESFRKANALLIAGDAPAALDAFEEVPSVGQYGSLVELYKGHAAVASKDLDMAAEAFRAATKSALPAYLRQEAFYGLGFVMSGSDPAAAIGYYEQAAELDGPYRVDSRVAAAQLSEAQGTKEKARALYQQAVTDADDDGPSQDDLRKLAQFRLTTLGGPIDPAPAE